MIINNDCLDEMRKMETNSISCIVTDPPYGLSFMGKGWDHAVPGVEYWKECFRILKPSGHLLAMGGTRTFHRLTAAIEDSGFEIRDCLMWIYGSGFPKSHNHFNIEGYGTALKPAYEPIIMAMKPCDGTFKENAEKWGQAGINIDRCRIGINGGTAKGSFPNQNSISCFGNGFNGACEIKDIGKGRWPANVMFDEEAAKMLDEQSGELKSGKLTPCKRNGKNPYSGGWGDPNGFFESNSGGASRFFYCAKTSPRERCEFNKHPTVKPLALMKYLITLVMPPKDGILLDPFAGSGSTILAAQQLGLKAIGIEKSAEYCEIARKRIENWVPEQTEPDLFDKAQ